jgi:hypothetical protein
MFKSDRTAKRAILILGAFFLVGAVVLFQDGKFSDVVLSLGMTLIFIWAYLNPWILQLDYDLFMFLDYKRMQHNSFAIAGLLIVTGSVVMMLW